MSSKYSYTNGNIYPKNNFYLLSSWNYGSYSPTNPFYKSYFCSRKQSANNKSNPNILANKKNFPRSTTTVQLTSGNSQYYKATKRILKEEERIVTDELLNCYNHYNKMQQHLKKGTFRPKSVNRIMKSKLIKENENPSKKVNEKKYKKYTYKLTFTEWLSVKNKQREIFKEIIKKQKEEDEIMKRESKKIDKKYQEVIEQKYREWKKKKDFESNKEKEKK